MISLLFNLIDISHIFSNKFRINFVLFSMKESGNDITEGNNSSNKLL